MSATAICGRSKRSRGAMSCSRPCIPHPLPCQLFHRTRPLLCSRDKASAVAVAGQMAAYFYLCSRRWAGEESCSGRQDKRYVTTKNGPCSCALHAWDVGRSSCGPPGGGRPPRSLAPSAVLNFSIVQLPRISHKAQSNLNHRLRSNNNNTAGFVHRWGGF